MMRKWLVTVKLNNDKKSVKDYTIEASSARKAKEMAEKYSRKKFHAESVEILAVKLLGAVETESEEDA